MNRIRLFRRRGGLALVFATLLFGVLATGASASHHTPFKGTFNEQFVPSTPCPTGFLCANASGTGSTSVIHNATESFYGVVDLALSDPTTHCSPDSATGSISGRTPNVLFVSSAGSFCPTSQSTGTDNGSFVIVGGTGRFAGATGGGTYTSSITFNPDGTGSSVETYDGDVVIP